MLRHNPKKSERSITISHLSGNDRAVQSKQVKDYLRKIGARGGKRALMTMTAEERSARAKNAVTAREAKRKAKESN